jgi:hypothetical protein
MENKEIFYEIWALGYDSEGEATDFDMDLGEFSDPQDAIEHARKFKDATYVLSADELYDLREEGTDYLELRVEACFEDEDEDGEFFTECEDVIYEATLPIPELTDIMNLPGFSYLNEAEEEDYETMTPEDRAELVFQLHNEMRRAEALNPLATSTARQKRIEEIRQTLSAEGADIAKIQTASTMMWKEFEGYDAERKDLRAQINRLTNPVMPVVVQVIEDDEGFNVLIEDRALGFEAWLDVFDGPCDEDWEVDWNQYIFCLTDVSDIYQKCCQENDNLAEWCFELAMNAADNIVNKKD